MKRARCSLAGLLLAIAACSMPLAYSALAAQPRFAQRWSSVPAKVFPGGTYKYSNTDNFPASAKMSAALITLVPGGVRELHWHTEVEWAFVLNGTCRATVMEQGAAQPAETWDFGPGDVWYFRSNEGHFVQGLAPDGCAYLAGYNSGTFDDRRSPSLSSFLSAVRPAVAGQSLGLPPSTVSAALAADTQTFLPLGPVPDQTLDEFRGSVKNAPAQPVVYTHRFQVTQAAPKVETAGGFVTVVDKATFAVSTDFSGALVTFAPGGMRQLHWHLNLDEWQFVVNGTVKAGVMTEPGVFEESALGAGDAGYAPIASAHYIVNDGPQDAFIVLMFDAGEFTNSDITALLGNVPPQVIATSLNSSLAFAEALSAGEPTVVPPVYGNTSIVLAG